MKLFDGEFATGELSMPSPETVARNAKNALSRLFSDVVREVFPDVTEEQIVGMHENMKRHGLDITAISYDKN